MTLKKLIFLTTFAYALVICGGLLFYRIFIAYPELAELTLETHRSGIRAINATYLDERYHLSFFNRDWAKWDETYDFILGNNTNFTERNINSHSFLKSNVDIVSIFNDKQQNVYTAKREDNRFIIEGSLLDYTSDINLQRALTQDEICGMVRTKEQIGYFCSHTIQDSEERKAPKGLLIFIRLVDEMFIKRLEELTQSRITLIPKDPLDDRIKPTLNKKNIEAIQLKNGLYEFNLVNHSSKVIGLFRIKYEQHNIPTQLDKTTIISLLILLTLPLLITVVVYYFVLKPMSKIFDSIGKMNKTGELKNIDFHTHISEIDIFTKNYNHFIQQIRLYQKKLENDSNTDGLTSLFNRRYFDQQYDEIWRSTTRNGHSLCIIMMDIDFFKKYNDLYGHQQGDDALKAVAHKLKKLVRRANETLARYGGEEFVLITESLNIDELNGLLSKIIDSIQSLKIEHKASEINEFLTISCGACFIKTPGSWMILKKDAALKTADDALYQAKKTGRNKYVVLPFDKTVSTDQDSSM